MRRDTVHGTVESSRAAIAPATLTVGVVAGPTGHEASAAIGYSWDDSSGYGAVEANRAALAPAIFVNQVSSDVRWAPEPVVAAGGAFVSRSSALGSVQEDYFAAAETASWDESSGYDSVEESRAVAGVYDPR